MASIVEEALPPIVADSDWEGTTVRRTLLTLTALAVWGLTLWAQPAKDTPSAAAVRKRLQAKISVEFKDERLQDVVKELEEKIRDAAGGGDVKFKIDNVGGVTNNITVGKYKAKSKPAVEVLDEIFKPMDLGYVVISKEYKTYKGGRFDGWVLIEKGKARGYPEGSEPGKDKAEEKPAKDKTAVKDKTAAKDKGKDDTKDKTAAKDKSEDKDKGGADDKAEEAAANALKLAKKRIDAGLKTKAKESLQSIIKEYPKTKAAAEAKVLLEKLK
jgi:hypothetical protein